MASEEASRPKFDNLPGIDTAPDVYETPELAEDVSTIQASTAISESDYGSDAENSGVSHQRLHADQARDRFQPSRIDANGVDFSDNVAQRQAYRTYTRQRRRGEILGDDSDEEHESFSRKLMRVKRELQELEDEYEQRKESGDKSQIEERDAKEVMDLISDKVDELYASRRGGTEALLDRTIQKYNSYEPFTPSSKITAAIANQPPLPGSQISRSQLDHVLNQAAEFDKRIAQMESSLGLNGASLPETSEDSTFPIFTTLQRLEQTLGAIGDASTNNLDGASLQIKNLIEEAESLKEARLEASQAGTADETTTSDQEAKINALYGTLPSIEKLSPLLPLVLERLRTLRLIHTSAWQADEVLTELESRQSKQEEEIEKWEKQLELVEGDIKKHEQAMQGNVKIVGDDIKMLEEKIARLLAEGKE